MADIDKNGRLNFPEFVAAPWATGTRGHGAAVSSKGGEYVSCVVNGRSERSKSSDRLSLGRLCRELPKSNG